MRLLTRSDFDGLVCAVLLFKLGYATSWKFVAPKDLKDWEQEVTSDDILANVPFVAGCSLWFDHHISEVDRGSLDKPFRGASQPAPSCARVIYNYYGGLETFGSDFNEMMDAVDKADTASFSVEEILNPSRWVLLSFIIDPRTSLELFDDYQVGKVELIDNLIENCRTKPIEQILELPYVKERVNRYWEHEPLHREMLRAHSRADGNVVITDLREVEPIYCGNRFIIYTMFPEQNMALRIYRNWANNKCLISCGRSILNRTSRTNVGLLMANYGGGGHSAVGTCQVDNSELDNVLEDIVKRIKIYG